MAVTWDAVYRKKGKSNHYSVVMIRTDGDDVTQYTIKDVCIVAGAEDAARADIIAVVKALRKNRASVTAASDQIDSILADVATELEDMEDE